MRTRLAPRNRLLPAVIAAAAAVLCANALLAAVPGGPAAQAASSASASVSAAARSSTELPAPSARREFTEPAVDPSCTKAVVLLYHAFDRGRGDLSTRSSRFEAHLLWLKENRIETISMQEFAAFLHDGLRLPERVALITIDDGDESVYERAWPILERHGARFVLGLPTSLMGSGQGGMMSWEQVNEMVGSGLCEVASHGHLHRGLVHFGREAALRELSTSRDIIQKRVGRDPIAFFYPLGAVDDRAEQYARDAGFLAAFTAQGAPIHQPSAPRFRIPRVTMLYSHGTIDLAWFYGSKFWGTDERHGGGCRR